MNYAFALSTDPEYSKEIFQKYTKDTYIQYIFWANEPLPSEFWDSISSNSLLSKPKIILLRHAQKIPHHEYTMIEKILLHNNAVFCFFALEHEKVPSYIEESTLYTKAKQHSHIHRYVAITRKNIMLYIKNYCQSKGYTITQEALLYLRDILPCTLSAIQNECNKYMLYASTQEIDKNNVQATSSYTTEHTIWELVEHILQSRDTLKLWTIISIKDNASFFKVSQAIQRELRILGGILSGDSISIPPYYREKKQQLAHKIQYHGIRAIFSFLASIEEGIKNGDISEEQALEYTICKIPYLITV